MLRSIATVSISGTLPEKLHAIAAAGYQGVEIFENDLLYYTGTPAEIRLLAADLGLKITLFQPFRDFEGASRAQFAANMARARRKFALMRELGCTKKVIVGGWSSAPYGTRLESIGKCVFPHVRAKYRAITLRGAALPMTDTDDFLEASKYLPCMDAVTNGDGPSKANTVLDVDFANVNPVIHVPATILGVSTMENWGVIFGGHDKTTYSMYSHGLCPSICEVQYQFYNEEIALAEAIGVGTPKYKKEMFFSRRSVLTQEYMGLDENGNDNVVFPLDQPSTEGNTGPNNIHHRYMTEDVPIGCKVYHDLGVAYGVKTPIIDSMITLAGAMHQKNFFEESRYNLAYLGIDGMSKDELLAYLNDGVYER